MSQFHFLTSRGFGVGEVDDIKIIYNDWPYGIDKSIVHLCVWTKFPLDVDETDPNGDLTPEMRGKIDRYVDTTFGSRVPAENVSSCLSTLPEFSILPLVKFIRKPCVFACLSVFLVLFCFVFLACVNDSVSEGLIAYFPPTNRALLT